MKLLLLTLACLAGLSGCTLMDSITPEGGFADSAGIVTITTETSPVIDPHTGKQAIDSQGRPVVEVTERRTIGPALTNTIASAARAVGTPWGEIANYALAGLNVLLGGLWIRKRREAQELKASVTTAKGT